MIPASTVARVLEATDLVQLVGAHVALRKSGASYVGRCPFHEERSPSFHVHPERRFYHCFGCGAGGDAIRFLQEHRGLAFADAVRHLAAPLGISVEGEAPARRAPRASRKEAPEKIAKTSSGGAAFDWAACVAAFTPRHAAELAAWRGYSADFTAWLHREGLVGLHRGRIALPVHDAAGKVARCHYRLEDGRWMYFPPQGESAPLVIGNPAEAGHTLAFESQWDAFAVLDRLGHHEDPSAYAAIITRGATSNTDFSAHAFPALLAIPQNDPPEKINKRTGRTPAEEWLERLRGTRAAGTRFLTAQVPEGHKDANDWIREAAPKPAEVRRVLVESARNPALAGVWNVGDLLRHDTRDDPLALIGPKRRFLSKGGSMIVTGPSGIGKSTLIASMAVHWAAGVPWHGIEVRRPLKILVVQAENDKGDLAEMFLGAEKSARVALGPENLTVMARNLGFVREVERTGEDFCKWLEEMLRESAADVVFIDPLLSYVGGDISSQEVASRFFRTWMQPVLNRTGAIAIFVHHTGKTSSDAKARAHWNSTDYSYIGIGSSEITNWPRAMAAIMPVPGHEGKYKFMLTKRGDRAGMLDMRRDVVKTIFLQHGRQCDGLAWDEIEDPEAEEKKPAAAAAATAAAGRTVFDVHGYLKFLPELFPFADAVRTLMQAGDLSMSQAKSTLSMLIKDRSIVKQADGRYGKRREGELL